MLTQRLFLLVALVFSVNCFDDDDEISTSPYILESESLPEDLNFMPTLGNGFLGFTVFGDTILANGIYNGKGGLSHRARIPNVGNISVIPIGSEAFTKDSFRMNLYTGIFERKQSNSEIEAIVRTYPHRYFNRAIINEVTIQRRSNAVVSQRPLKFLIDVKPGELSSDFTPLSSTRSVDKKVVFCEQTKEMEDPELQTFKPYVCLAMNVWPSRVELLPNQTSIVMRIVVAIGETAIIAVNELNAVLSKSNDEILKSHIGQWKEFWKCFHIDMIGSLDLARTINAGIFYLASCMPSANVNQPSVFFGLSPTGLGRGNLVDDYQGHNFWDTEIWMLPVVTSMATYWGRELLSYRFRKLNAAIDNAKQRGNSGAQFPWESALTGAEVTHPSYPKIAAQQIHVSADIAFAARHYFIITNDTAWMKSQGCELSRRIAEFWVNRVSLDEKTGQYDIKNVMGPDEDHENVKNNAYTNLVVHHALEFIHLTQSVCGTDPSFAAKCLDIAEKLKVPYDSKLDYNPQYEGYTPGTRIKQADAVLLSYPMLYPMNPSTLSNNLRIYENVTRASGPAMTWSIHAIGHLDEGNTEKAKMYFKKGYKDYVRGPFKVWSELVEGKDGAVNFLTGVGGFLQAVINGYGGIRFHSDRMEIRKPSLLPGTKSAIISGIEYLGSAFTIRLWKKPTLKVYYLKEPLHLVDADNKGQLMVVDVEYPIEKTMFVKAKIN